MNRVVVNQLTVDRLTGRQVELDRSTGRQVDTFICLLNNVSERLRVDRLTVRHVHILTKYVVLSG